MYQVDGERLVLWKLLFWARLQIMHFNHFTVNKSFNGKNHSRSGLLMPQAMSTDATYTPTTPPSASKEVVGCRGGERGSPNDHL